MKDNLSDIWNDLILNLKRRQKRKLEIIGKSFLLTKF